MANPEHLELLLDGIDTWNEWREEFPTVEPDLSEADLAGVNLKGAYLSGTVSYYDAELDDYLAPIVINRASQSMMPTMSDQELSYMRTWGANLEGVDFTGAYLNRAYLGYAVLTGARFQGADLRYASFSHANLHRADMPQVNAQGTDFSHCLMREVNLHQANCRRANFSHAEVRRSNLSEAILAGADFSSADLSRSNLQSSDLDSALLRHTLLTETDFTDAQLLGTLIDGIDLRPALNLDRLRTIGNCSLTISTIELSAFQLPDKIMHGAGLSEKWRAFINSQ